MCWYGWYPQTGKETGSVEVPSEVEVGTGLTVAVAAALMVAAAEGWTSGSSCSHPGLIEVSVAADGVQKAVHIVLAAEESACEARKVGHTGLVAVAEVNIGVVVVVVVGRKREEIEHSQS
jgi:hypothetical protein